MAKRSTVVTLMLVAIIGIPSVVWAASAAYKSGGSGSTLRVENTGAGKAIQSTSNAGHAVFALRRKTSGATPAIFGKTLSSEADASAIFGLAPKPSGRTYGLFGRTKSSGTNASGVFGYASDNEGLTNGVWGRSLSTDGVGVYGTATAGLGTGGLFSGAFVGASGDGAFGLVGIGEVVGAYGSTAGLSDGSYGVYSESDAGVGGHLVAGGANVAGTCTVANGTSSVDCAFDDPFAAAPIVVLTPLSNPGAFWWVSSTTDDFTITTAAAVSGNVTFNYIAIGLDSNLLPASTGASGGLGMRAPRL